MGKRERVHSPRAIIYIRESESINGLIEFKKRLSLPERALMRGAIVSGLSVMKQRKTEQHMALVKKAELTTAVETCVQRESPICL